MTDALGRIIQVVEDPGGLNYQTNYIYDALGNLRQVQQGAQSRYFMYDSLSRLIRAKNPEQSANSILALTDPDPVTGNNSWSTSYAYDENGNLTLRTDARNVTASYSYDALNRNIIVAYTNDPAATPTVTRSYDTATNGRGRLYQSITSDSAGSISRINSYDAMGRPLSQTQYFYSGGWIGYQMQRTYDLGGHVTWQSYPSGRTVSYGYDIVGRTQSFTGYLGDGSYRSYATNINYSRWGMGQEQYGTTT